MTPLPSMLPPGPSPAPRGGGEGGAGDGETPADGRTDFASLLAGAAAPATPTAPAAPATVASAEGGATRMVPGVIAADAAPEAPMPAVRAMMAPVAIVEAEVGPPPTPALPLASPPTADALVRAAAPLAEVPITEPPRSASVPRSAPTPVVGEAAVDAPADVEGAVGAEGTDDAPRDAPAAAPDGSARAEGAAARATSALIAALGATPAAATEAAAPTPPVPSPTPGPGMPPARPAGPVLTATATPIEWGGDVAGVLAPLASLRDLLRAPATREVQAPLAASVDDTGTDTTTAAARPAAPTDAQGPGVGGRSGGALHAEALVAPAVAARPDDGGGELPGGQAVPQGPPAAPGRNAPLGVPDMDSTEEQTVESRREEGAAVAPRPGPSATGQADTGIALPASGPATVGAPREAPPRAVVAPAAPPEPPAPLPVPTSHVTVDLALADGSAGRLRVAVRGEAVHATILAAGSAAIALERDLPLLRRALAERGFAEAQIVVRAPGVEALAAPTAPTTTERPGADLPREDPARREARPDRQHPTDDGRPRDRRRPPQPEDPS